MQRIIYTLYINIHTLIYSRNWILERDDSDNLIIEPLDLVVQTLPMRSPRFAPPRRTHLGHNFAQPRNVAEPLAAI
jgi:hypothetical protein